MNVAAIRFLLVLLSIFASESVVADIILPAIISDHMVLKRGPDVGIWGRADSGEEVTVSLDSQVRKAVADADGNWRVVFDLRKTGNGPFEMPVKGKNELRIADVVVGEVWVVSGQSNMAVGVGGSPGGKEDRLANQYLRRFHVAQKKVGVPSNDAEGVWVSASGEEAGRFSAVGYYFGKSLNSRLGVPVGLITAVVGSSNTEAWTSTEAIDSIPELKAGKIRRESEAAQAAAAAGPPGKPPQNSEFVASSLFNGMIHPLLPYAISGVIWYQGETQASRAFQYRTAFPLLISDWRVRWKQGDFPFYFCQLPGFREKIGQPGDSTWAELREAQQMTLALPNTGQAVLIDLGESEDIHPANKRDVGERLSRVALAKKYGQNISFCGPVYERMEIKNGRVILSFKHTDGGLKAAPLADTYIVNSSKNQRAPLVRNSPKSQLEGFAICGKDKHWEWAEAAIEGENVVVWSEKVPSPVAVRYAWADNPTCNLTNASGLPAGSFRTDNFPQVTAQARY